MDMSNKIIDILKKISCRLLKAIEMYRVACMGLRMVASRLPNTEISMKCHSAYGTSRLSASSK